VGAKRYTDLEVWQLANNVRCLVRDIVGRLDPVKDAWLRQQLRKAANSACAAISEGFGRYTPLDFARFLRISKGSLEEIRDHGTEPEVAAVTTPDERDELETAIGRAIGAEVRLIGYLRTAKAPEGRRRRTLNPEP